jgi:hypothetical protein
MRGFIRIARRRPCRAHKASHCFLWLLAVTGLLSGCIPKVHLPAVDQFRVASDAQEGIIDADQNEQILLTRFYQLMKANQGAEVPICTASRDSRQCTKSGVRFFIWGGIIPGVGKRAGYSFSEIALHDRELEFTKDNSRTTFCGTPVWTVSNKCRAHVADGGLQVQMNKYYGNWMGVGNMMTAEGWAIDYMDFNRGIVGMQLRLDTKGILTMGGGSRYVLLKFPKIPESPLLPATPLKFLDRK